jgi:hypothetical protein
MRNILIISSELEIKRGFTTLPYYDLNMILFSMLRKLSEFCCLEGKQVGLLRSRRG